MHRTYIIGVLGLHSLHHTVSHSSPETVSVLFSAYFSHSQSMLSEPSGQSIADALVQLENARVPIDCIVRKILAGEVNVIIEIWLARAY